MDDQEHSDMLHGKRKRLKREIRRDIAAVTRRIAWVREGTRERADVLTDEVIDQFALDMPEEIEKLTIKLYELVAVRAELEKG